VTHLFLAQAQDLAGCTRGADDAKHALVPAPFSHQTSPEFSLRIWLGKPTLGYMHQLKQ
jgi:hypothetical protein